MSWLGISSRLAGRCTACLAGRSMAFPTRRSHVLLIHKLRHASTAVKSRAKPAAPAAPDAASVAKKGISTTTTTATVSAKIPRRKKKSEAVADAATSDTVAPAPKKSTRSASTKTSAPSAKKKAEAVSGDTEASTNGARFTAATRTRKSLAVSSKGSTTNSEEPAASSTQSFEDPAHPLTIKTAVALAEPRSRLAASPPGQANESAEAPKAVDRSSPEYKQAYRRYTSLMVALPILLVTSYYLFDRLALGHAPQNLDGFRVLKPEQEGKEGGAQPAGG